MARIDTYPADSFVSRQIRRLGNAGMYDTVAAVQAATVPAELNYIQVSGYHSAGDGGNAIYKRVVVQPSHSLKIQSADGAWWEIGETRLNVLQAGAVGDGATDSLAAFQRLRDYHASGTSCTIYVPKGAYAFSSNFLEGTRAITLECEGGVTFPGPGLAFVTCRRFDSPSAKETYITALPGEHNTNVPADDVVGMYWSVTNESPNAGYGIRYNYVCTGTQFAGNDIGIGFAADWRAATGGGGLLQWNIYHTPNSATWAGGYVWTEINPVNRGPDMGWANKPGSLTRWVGGARFVPESQDFTGLGGDGNHVLFGFTCSRSGALNGSGVYTRTYNCFLVEPDAVAPNGFGLYINGNEDTSDRYTAVGAQFPLKAGVDFTAASFDSDQAIKLDVSDKVGWYSSSTERAYVLGENGYLALWPGATGYVALAKPDSTTAGGNTRGSNAVDLQSARTNANQVASGTASAILGGIYNRANGANATAIGGYNNLSDGTLSITAGGGAVARGMAGKRAYTYGGFAASGDCQEAWHVLRRQTTDGTTVALSVDGSTPATATALALPNNSVYAFTGEIVARNTSTNDVSMWTIVGLVKRGANAAATALVGTPTVTKVFNDSGASAWTAAVVAETTIGSVQFNVTGAAATTIRWYASIKTVEIV